MVLTVMITVCMMNSIHSRLLPIMLLLHSIHDILSAARHLRLMNEKMVYIGIYGIDPYIWGAIKAGRSLARNSARSARYTVVTTTYRSVRCMVCALV